MLAKEAYKKALTFEAGLVGIKCMEYKSIFVFQMLPEELIDLHDTEKVLDCTVSVNKHTGETKAFHPFNISPEEFKRGREIKPTLWRNGVN